MLQDELPEELIEKVKYKVNRDSPEDKTRDYLDWMNAVKKEMFHIVRTCVCMHGITSSRTCKVTCVVQSSSNRCPKTDLMNRIYTFIIRTFWVASNYILLRAVCSPVQL